MEANGNNLVIRKYDNQDNVTDKNATTFRKDAINTAMELFRDTEVTIIDTCSIAEINKSGITKTFSGNVTVDKIQTANDLASIIEQSIYVYSTHDLQDKNETLYHHFFTPVSFDNKNELIRVVIKEFPRDKTINDKYYYHQLELINSKKIEGSSGTLPHNMEIRHFKPSPSTINNSITQKNQTVKSSTAINNKSMQNAENNTKISYVKNIQKELHNRIQNAIISKNSRKNTFLGTVTQKVVDKVKNYMVLMYLIETIY